ncbi:MAG: hypothetical protein AB1349_07505 [Elusimicrobiota bacterium]
MNIKVVPTKSCQKTAFSRIFQVKHERYFSYSDENDKDEEAEEYEIKKGAGPCDILKSQTPSKEAGKDIKKNKPKK